MARYVVGQPVVLDATFTVAGVLTDPTTISLTVTDPTGNVTGYTYAGTTITRSGTGAYTVTVDATLAGVWSYKWVGTGTAADVQDGTFTVFADVPLVLPTYATLDELKTYQNITNTNDDMAMQMALESVSRWIDGYCNDKFWLDPNAVPRTFTADNYWRLAVPAIGNSTVTVATDSNGTGTYTTIWTGTDFVLEPVDAPYTAEPTPWRTIRAIASLMFPIVFTRGRTNLVQVTARWGWPAIPTAVRQACLLQAARVWKRKDSPEGVAGFSDFGVVRVGARVDPDVEQMLNPYKRHAFA